VFAESEVISLVNDGVDPVDIAAGLHVSIAGRLSSLVRSVGAIEDITVSGGCAKNRGLVESLQKKLSMTIKPLPEDPQMVGALGAAIIARERLGA
jgi:activator of 2-hydroxyglutaryl-CoA dehydratase